MKVECVSCRQGPNRVMRGILLDGLIDLALKYLFLLIKSTIEK